MNLENFWNSHQGGFRKCWFRIWTFFYRFRPLEGGSFKLWKIQNIEYMVWYICHSNANFTQNSNLAPISMIIDPIPYVTKKTVTSTCALGRLSPFDHRNWGKRQVPGYQHFRSNCKKLKHKIYTKKKGLFYIYTYVFEPTL